MMIDGRINFNMSNNKPKKYVCLKGRCPETGRLMKMVMVKCIDNIAKRNGFLPLESLVDNGYHSYISKDGKRRFSFNNEICRLSSYTNYESGMSFFFGCMSDSDINDILKSPCNVARFAYDIRSNIHA